MARVITLKHGNKYSSRYVNILHARIKHFNPHYEFVCYTDNTNGLDPEIRTRELDTTLGLYGWWFKTWILNQQLPGPNIFLDLDVLITGSLEPFLVPYTGLGIIQNGRGINSSIMTWRNRVPWVWSVFDSQRDYHLAQKPPYGDQEIIELAQQRGLVLDYFNQQMVAWLRVAREGGGARNLNNTTRAIICKGPRNPHDHPNHELVRQFWCRP